MKIAQSSNLLDRTSTVDSQINRGRGEIIESHVIEKETKILDPYDVRKWWKNHLAYTLARCTHDRLECNL